MRLEHVGIAVAEGKTGMDLFTRLFGKAPYKTEKVETEGVTTTFFDAGTAKIELLTSIQKDSPVGRFLDKKGPGIHHLAFEVDDLEETMQEMKERGFQPLSEEPRKGADGKRVFFLHPKQTGGVLIEFCQQISAP